MKTEPENFESLRKLLAMKRHEQPPPGYFEQFSSEVMARLRSGEHRQKDLWKDLGDEASWLQRLWSLFDAKPALAGAFGVMVCGAMLSGLYLSQQPETVATAGTPAIASGANLSLASGALALSQTAGNSSTNPVLNSSAGSLTGTTLFDRIGVPGQPVPVSFSPGGN